MPSNPAFAINSQSSSTPFVTGGWNIFENTWNAGFGGGGVRSSSSAGAFARGANGFAFRARGASMVPHPASASAPSDTKSLLFNMPKPLDGSDRMSGVYHKSAEREMEDRPRENITSGLPIASNTAR